MRSSRRWILCTSLLLVVLSLAGCSEDPLSEQLTPTPLSLRMTQYENDQAFDLLYPSDWTYMIVQPGLILFGELKTVNQQEAGASLSVFRQAPEDFRGGLEGAYQHYLENGPLRSGFVAEGDVISTVLGGKEALQMMLERDADGELPGAKAHIVAALSDSGQVYVLSATAPIEQWDEHWASFQVSIGSFEFNE